LEEIGLLTGVLTGSFSLDACVQNVKLSVLRLDLKMTITFFTE